jgi:2',3'-cyclic-nucleotide 2'-phosphodiesterase (5'-nucleotidase family)
MPLLVLDAGDALMGDRTPATSSRGKSSVEIMNMIGYDAAALGEGDLSQLGIDLIRERMAEAAFPMLSANAYDASSGELLAKPYYITDAGSHRVAVIGLTGAAQIAGVAIADPLKTAQEVVTTLAGKADILILLSHAGLDVNEQIAQAVPEIDLIVSGGGQRMTPNAEAGAGNPVVVHADVPTIGHAGRRLGVGPLGFDAAGMLQGYQWESLALGSDIPDNAAMRAWVEQNP